MLNTDDVLRVMMVAYLAIINIIGFAAMGMDKRRARKGAWRIPEARLFLFAALGGSPGSWIGMYAFRHKTRHWYFVVGMPVILVLQIVLGVLIKTTVF